MAQRPRFPYKRFALPNLGQRKQNVSWMVFRRGLHPMPPERSKPHWPTSDDDGANSGGANSDDDSSGGANSGGASNGDGDARRDPWCAFHLRSQSSSRQCKTRRPTIGLVCISWDGGNESSRRIHKPSSRVHFQFFTNCKSLIALGLIQKAAGVGRQNEIGYREFLSGYRSDPQTPARLPRRSLRWSPGRLG